MIVKKVIRASEWNFKFMLEATLSGYVVDAENATIISLPPFYAARAHIESDFGAGGQIARKSRAYIRLLNDVCSLAYNHTFRIQKYPFLAGIRKR